MTKEERDQEILEWYPLVDVVVNKFLKVHGFKQLRQHRDDLVGEGTLGLMEAIETYEESHGTAKVSWYSLNIRSKILHYIRDFEDNARVGWKVSLDDLIKNNKEHEEYFSYNSEEEENYTDPDYTLIDKYEPRGEINKAIYHRILMGSATQREIAEEFGVSKKAIESRKKRMVRRLRKEMELDNILEEVANEE